MREMQIHNKLNVQFKDTNFILAVKITVQMLVEGEKYFGILEYFVITRLIFAYTFFSHNVYNSFFIYLKNASNCCVCHF